jgi:transcriptional regulator with XRE-family HTH domain
VEPVQPNFGIRIKKLRFDLNMSQQELADLCELSVDQVSNIERGRSWTGEVSIALLADAFRVPHRALLDYSENDAFVRSGGLIWRSSRKKSNITVRQRKVDVCVLKTRR